MVKTRFEKMLDDLEINPALIDGIEKDKSEIEKYKKEIVKIEKSLFEKQFKIQKILVNLTNHFYSHLYSYRNICDSNEPFFVDYVKTLEKDKDFLNKNIFLIKKFFKFLKFEDKLIPICYFLNDKILNNFSDYEKYISYEVKKDYFILSLTEGVFREIKVTFNFNMEIINIEQTEYGNNVDNLSLCERLSYILNKFKIRD